MRKILAILFLFAAAVAFGQVPAGRIPYPDGYWHPGIPGGIPVYPTSIYLTNYGGVADGTTDNTAAMNAAITACTNGGAIYAGPGVWRFNSAWSFPTSKSIVVRGAGRNGTNATIFKTYSSGGDGSIRFVGGYSSSASYWSNGFTQWSTNATVSSTSGLHVGDISRFLQSDDATVVGSGNGWETTQPHQGEFLRILSVSGNNITFTPPIFYDRYNLTNSPRFTHSANHSVQRCGIEDLAIEEDGTSPSIVYFYFADQCWVLRVATTNAVSQHYAVLDSLNCEIRHSDMWYHQTYDANSRTGVNMNEYSTGNWVEDCISQMGNLDMMMQYMAAGNVFSYNCSTMGAGNGYPTYNGAQGFYCFHGDHPNYNLMEGNVMPWFSSDNYWGDNPHNTVFRNWVMMMSTNNTSGLQTPSGAKLSYFDAAGYYNSAVANIFGSPRDSGTSVLNNRWIDIGEYRYEDGEAQTSYDPKVTNTIVFLKNFQWNNATTWSNYSGTISNSYLYTSKPAWFGTLAWPPFGPDVDTTAGITNGPKIPAQYRLYTGNEVPSQDPSIPTQPTTQNVFSNFTATFSLTAAGNTALSYQWNWYGTNVTGATSASWVTPPVFPVNSNSPVYCVVTDTAGSITSSVVTMSVFPDPYITVQPANQYTVAGNTATFSVQAIGNTALQYKWYWYATNVPNATGSSWTTPALQTRDNLSQVYCNVVDALVNVNTVVVTNFVTSALAPTTGSTKKLNAKDNHSAAAPSQ